MDREILQIIAKIEETYSSISYRGQTIICLDHDEIKDTSLIDEIGIDFFMEIGVSEYMLKNGNGDKEKKALSKKIFQALRKKHHREKTSAIKKTTTATPESRPDFDMYIPAVDVETSNKLLINSKTSEVSRIKYEVWFDALPVEQKQMVPEVTRYSIFKYDPYDISTMNMIPYENFNILKINLYSPPAWRLSDQPETQECPELIWRFLCHLFPSPKSRNYVLDWCYWALVKRQETYLVLNGAKGIGKGLFQKLLRMLVGRDNYAEAPEGLLDSQFNSVLDKKRIIVFDELKVDKERHTRLKRYINKFQNIEKKGMDADKSIETFNSFVIANNDEKDMYIEYDDRRFSVMDMTDKGLYESMDKEEVAELDRLIEEEDADLAFAFGYFIYNRGYKYHDEFSIYKGDKFYKLAHSSLAAWKKLLLDKILIDKESHINIERLRKLDKANNPRSQFPKDMQRIQDFVTNYRHNGTEVLGTLYQEDGDLYLEANPSLVGEEDTDLL